LKKDKAKKSPYMDLLENDVERQTRFEDSFPCLPTKSFKGVETKNEENIVWKNI